MTLDTLRGSIPILANRLAIRLPCRFVAVGAADITMRNVQREARALVIELANAPTRGCMARGAIFLASLLTELASVSICLQVASGALSGSRREVAPRLVVAVDTFRLFMRPVNLEPALRVIVRANRFPRRGDMTGVACQLGLVRIGMAGIAGLGREVIPARRGHRRGIRQRFVAGVAANGGMLSGQREMGLRVPLHGEGRGCEAGHGVAQAALVSIWRFRKLPGMRIGVAGGAGQLSGRVYRGFALRTVAPGAFEQGMLPFQREGALTVGLAVEPRRLESCVVVTRRAIRPGGARSKLRAVRILVAILAALVGNGPPEIASFMTLRTSLLRMLPGEWKPGSGMAETGAGTIILPATGVVAVVAGPSKPGLAECRAMRVGVAALTGAEREPGELHFVLARSGSMTFLARSRLMQSRQREARSGVIESCCRFPGLLRVTAGALRAHLTAVPVFVAGRALLPKAQKSRVEIF